MALSPQDKLAAGRRYVAQRAPYFVSGLLALVPRETPGLGTFAVTDKAVLLWDPAAADRWTVAQVGAVLVHELWHVWRRHAKRRLALGADPDLKAWNWAADAEINDDLVAGGWDLPESPVLPSTLGQPDGKLAEEYYRAQQQQGGQGGGAGAKPKGGKGKACAGGGAGGCAPPDAEGPRAGGGWCGGCAGRPVPGEAEAAAQETGRTEAEMARIERATAEAVRDYAAKHPGKLPGGWARWAEVSLTPPKVPWQTLLQRAVRAAVAYRAGAVDYRYDRPARRQAAVGYGNGRPIFPALRSPVPRVACAIDTSGSMTGEILATVIGEARGVLRAVRADVQLVACDAQVHALKPVQRWEQIPGLLKGGGGTDFRPVFDALARAKPRPEVVIVMTDLYGPAPELTPAWCHVIWLAVGESVGSSPGWGTIIRVE